MVYGFLIQKAVSFLAIFLMFWFYMFMTGMVSNSVNFGSRPLHSVNLRRGDGGGFVRAVVSELDPKDSEDIEALKKINSNWLGARFTRDILGYFTGNKELRGSTHFAFYQKLYPPVASFFAVELQEQKPLSERIVGVFQTVFENAFNCKNLDLAYLQVHPDFMHKDNSPGRTIKGVGEISLGKTVSLAKELESPAVSIESDNDRFYYTTFNNAGVKVLDKREYDYSRNIFVQSNDYQKYLDYIDQKYKAKF